MSEHPRDLDARTMLPSPFPPSAAAAAAAAVGAAASRSLAISPSQQAAPATAAATGPLQLSTGLPSEADFLSEIGPFCEERGYVLLRLFCSRRLGLTGMGSTASRSTSDPEPAVRRSTSYLLLRAVVERGGFEVLSAARLGGEGWRQVTRDLGWARQEFLSFLLKDIYLRNLA
jgi:hypothetical protein